MPALAGFTQVYAAFLPQLLIAYAFLDRALTPRWGAALRVTQAAVAVLLVLPVGDTSTVGTALFVGVAMPLVFYKDDVRFRLLVAALLTVVTSVSEFSGIAFWMIATGRAESNSVVESLAHYPAHVASSLLCAAVSALALWVFLRQLAVVRARLHGRELTLVGFLVLQAAANNQNAGPAMAFMGMNMAGQAGGVNAQNLYQMGAQQAAQQPAPAAAAPAAPAGAWTCPQCGKTATGKFCPECGAKKPEADGWTCPTCGKLNKGKFCAECGTKKPAGTPKYKCDKCGWEPEDPTHPPKFCPECGDPFNDGDIIV